MGLCFSLKNRRMLYRRSQKISRSTYSSACVNCNGTSNFLTMPWRMDAKFFADRFRATQSCHSQQTDVPTHAFQTHPAILQPARFGAIRRISPTKISRVACSLRRRAPWRGVARLRLQPEAEFSDHLSESNRRSALDVRFRRRMVWMEFDSCGFSDGVDAARPGQLRDADGTAYRESSSRSSVCRRKATAAAFLFKGKMG